MEVGWDWVRVVGSNLDPNGEKIIDFSFSLLSEWI